MLPSDIDQHTKRLRLISCQYDLHADKEQGRYSYCWHRTFLSLCSAFLFTLITSCAHTVTTKQPASPDQLRNDSFLDLQPGGRLRIVMPIVKPGTSSVITGSQKQEGSTIVLSASNLVGYSSSYYAIEARGSGKVRLRFASAEITKDGVARPEAEPPQLPFALPEKAGLIRLIYLLRSSQSDHNMAIVATAKPALLQTFTEQVQADPSRCAISKQIFCSWVPAGIAVRPESPQRSN